MRWKSFLFILIAVTLAGGGYFAWLKFKPSELPFGIVKSNGRLEAERVDIATKFPGRVKDVLVREGDNVTEGQVLARIDTTELEAQLQEAEAAVTESEQQLDQAIALLAQRKSELTLSGQELERSQILEKKGFTTREKVEQRQAANFAAQAAVNSATAGIERAKAGIVAAVARVERIQVNLKDYVLTAPTAGRVQYRLVQPGEVIGAGGRVLTILDLSDVYMTIFLSTSNIGTLEIGSEARIVPDVASEYVVPAIVSFVASDAQFTPKYVETESEREKLAYRVKIRLPEEILKRYATRVRAGITGVAYVKNASNAQWPDFLKVNLPEVEEPGNE